MIALDTNTILYLLVHTMPEHPRAKAWLQANTEPLATTSVNLSESLRLISHPRVFPKPLKLSEACKTLAGFISEWDVQLLEENPKWLSELAELSLELESLKGNEVFDAQIALYLKHNGVKKIATLDDDFRKFSFLKVVTY